MAVTLFLLSKSELVSLNLQTFIPSAMAGFLMRRIQLRSIVRIENGHYRKLWILTNSLLTMIAQFMPGGLDPSMPHEDGSEGALVAVGHRRSIARG